MIRPGQDTDKETLISLWKLCFPRDSERFINFYFNNVYANDETFVYVEDILPVASLQIIPYQIKTSNDLYKGGYISGAMTHPDHRKKGFMSELLNFSFDEMMKKGFDYTFLIPQEKWLIPVYEKYGYKLCEPSYYPHKNIVLKTSKQWTNIRQAFFDENSIWLEKELEPTIEHKGMIKRLNSDVKDITALYMGMMLD